MTNEYLLLKLVREDYRLLKAFGVCLNEVWYARSLVHTNSTGRQAPCECVFYEPGDYRTAYEKAIELIK